MNKIASIIQNMSNETRVKAEAFARAKGLSLEDAVAAQLDRELTAEELQAVMGGQNNLVPVEENNEET